MNTEHIIEELRAIAHKAVDDMLAVLASGTDTARLAQQRLADLTKVQQLVLEEQPTPVISEAPKKWSMERTERMNRIWTDEEDDLLIAGRRLGLTSAEIGVKLGRSAISVINRASKLKAEGGNV